MTDSYTRARDLVRGLPHGPFTVEPFTLREAPDIPLLRVVCRCGRALPWTRPLDGALMLEWLLDHDADVFLTDEQRAARDSATLDQALWRRVQGLPSAAEAAGIRLTVDPAMPPGVLRAVGPAGSAWITGIGGDGD